MKPYLFKTPQDWLHVEITNGSITKQVIEYRFSVDRGFE